MSIIIIIISRTSKTQLYTTVSLSSLWLVKYSAIHYYLLQFARSLLCVLISKINLLHPQIMLR